MTSPPLQSSETSVAVLPAPVIVAARDGAIARMMAMALRLEGYQPHLYDDGRPTLEAMLERPYAAAVLDAHLPTVDGLAICRQVRSGASPVSSVPIILLMMYEDAAAWHVYRQQLRINAVLYIPFQVRDLLEAVHEATQPS
jgi:DNA-binding response OmpR family regulator